jgi:hypothetical protein
VTTEAFDKSDNLSLCPMCHGHKFDDTPSNQLGGSRVPVCRVCKGRGFVHRDKVCECGGAAVWYDTEGKVWYCGRAQCLTYAKQRAKGVTHSAAWIGA